MKRYLLPENGSFYKANLHCHSTFSDGSKTPEEIKELYLKKGYSIVAYTDHDVFLPHNELTDESFLALNGFEVEIMNTYGSHPLSHVGRCDINFIALEEDNWIQPFWHRTNYVYGNAKNYRDLVQFDENAKNYYRSYTPECISEMMGIGRKKGFFVILNHPTWSRELYTNYSKYQGMHAMEMFNGNSLSCGHEDYNPRVYDDILRTGKKIGCVGADDNHNAHPDDSRYSDSGWAWTVIKADKLEYRAVTRALENRHYYASNGPEIYSLYAEDGEIHIKCSPADQIYINFGLRGARNILAEHGELLTEATFGTDPNLEYFRITVVDERGKRACTNAYFPEDYL